LRMGDVDNFAGLMLATDLSDIIFGIPTPKVVTANYSVLKEGEVNIAATGTTRSSPPKWRSGRPARGGGEGGRGGAGERGRDLLHRDDW